MNNKRKTILTLIIGLATASGAMAAGGAPANYDVNKPAWFGGLIVQTYARIPRPGSDVAPSPQRRDDTAYLVGNIFDPTPFAAEIIVPLPPGAPMPFITVPAHDDVFTRWAPCARPSDAFGHWVVAGPNAFTNEPGANVKVRPLPQNSLAGAPLAYAVKLQGKWRLLTNGRTVEQGVNHGLLATVPAGPNNGFGGIGCLDWGVKF